MIIENSRVGMSSSRTYSSMSMQQSVTLTRRADQAAVFDLSEEGKSLMEQMNDIQEEEKNQKQRQEEENVKNALARMMGNQTEKMKQVGVPEAKSEKEMQLEVLKRILESLQRMRSGSTGRIRVGANQNFKMEMYSSQSRSFGIVGAQGVAASGSSAVRVGNGTVMTKQTVVSGFFSEQETTAFSANGMVHTADGRDISFGVSFEMSQAFAAKYEFLQQEDYILTDPLVINMDDKVTEIRDQKFYFDLDSDGK